MSETDQDKVQRLCDFILKFTDTRNPMRKVFPNHVAIDNPIAHIYSLRFDREIEIYEKHLLKGRGEPIKVLDWKADLPYHEAALLFRPYIRTIKGMPHGKLTFKFDEERDPLIHDIPMGYLHVKDMEDPKLECPMPELQSWPRNQYMHAELWKEDGYANQGEIHGIFATSSYRVEGWVNGFWHFEEVETEVEVGVVAAVYTSKDLPSFETCWNFSQPEKSSQCGRYPGRFCSGCGRSFCETCWTLHRGSCI